MKKPAEKTERYLHHGSLVAVQTKLKGKHREHCLCFGCKEFTADRRVANCNIANAVYALCVLQSLVLPVWECPDFVPRQEAKTDVSA